MALDDNFANETAVSATFNPTESVSEFSIYGTFLGTVRLQHSSPGDNRWIDADVLINQTSCLIQYSQVIETPDLLRDYRFSGEGIVGTVYVYFGA
jgi:hypothetical protein